VLEQVPSDQNLQTLGSQGCADGTRRIDPDREADELDMHRIDVLLRRRM
jgi:hypothetical protein